jgi:Fe-S-cluster-containing hydrogenase component 2
MPLVCQQCERAPCIDTCPSDALSRSAGILKVDAGLCTGCGDCTDACPAGCIFPDDQTGVAICCDLCGSEPQCVALCHSSCLTLSEGGDESELPRVERLAKILKEENLGEI